ncbi:hypothetical protein AVEN_113356-1 [Araneus ventricosus]|uniref:Uncharacterized protein n=1 Tax=Araneus ventricosus TaxID=182803 RepID=A0A4Y2T956_ARAVE|nr:hypothetical protein AVEN_10737-1 [Araneus ventricosus]GBN74333.1 hypothetical protein AVEN_172113-1 [Araneus ventricosus]GBN96013.1 hypothetical protein AVEN_63910-1 [Araneus ventricosus]GBN96016.1 hypothetical protein AVEN_113356-1 [Araneus ventricosus]
MKAGLRRLGSFEGRGGTEIASDISAVGGPIILANRSLFPSALREGYNRRWGGGVNDHPCWVSPIHVASSQKDPVVKRLEEKSPLGIKELNETYSLVAKH